MQENYEIIPKVDYENDLKERIFKYKRRCISEYNAIKQQNSDIPGLPELDGFLSTEEENRTVQEEYKILQQCYQKKQELSDTIENSDIRKTQREAQRIANEEKDRKEKEQFELDKKKYFGENEWKKPKLLADYRADFFQKYQNRKRRVVEDDDSDPDAYVRTLIEFAKKRENASH